MVNCGRCGRPIYEAGQPICKFCRKTMVKGANKKADRMNRRKDMEEDLVAAYSGAGEDGEEDAASAWVDEDFDKGKGKKG